MDSDFIQSEHVTHTPAPPITDLNGAYSVVQRLRSRLQTAVRGRDEVKFVIAHRDDYAFMLDLLPRIDTRRNVVNASPLFGELDPAKLAEWMLEDGLDLRLNLQQHKYIWDPARRSV